MPTDLFIALSLFAAPASGAGLAPPDEFLDSLQAPVSFTHVRPVVELSGGINLEISYDLPEVDRVSLDVRTDDRGSGLGFVTVDATVVAELRFTEGSLVWRTGNFSALSPSQARAVAASIIQVWDEDAVTEAFAVAAIHDRDLKCLLAGQIAGAVTGVGVFAACELLQKNVVKCGKAGGTVWGYVGFHITNKCNSVQNR